MPSFRPSRLAFAALAVLLPAAMVASCGKSTSNGKANPPPPAEEHADAGLPPLFRPVLETDAPLLGAWGASAADLFFVGGASDRSRVVALRDGHAWKIDPGTKNALWWVHGLSRDDVWAVGEHGTIVHFDGQRFSTVESGLPDATFWGVFCAAANDIWVVGGSTRIGGPKTVLLRGDGHTFTKVEIPNAPQVNLYKVWGSGDGELFIVGEKGVIYLFRNGTFTRLESGTEDTLFTVTGRASNDVYAVGGTSAGTALHWDGKAWSPLDPGNLPRVLNGVSVAKGRNAVVVGLNGYVAIENDGAFNAIDPVTPFTLHVTWTDGRDVTVAAGGNLYDSAATPKGVVLGTSSLSVPALEDWPIAPLVDAGTPADAGLAADAASIPDDAATLPDDASAPDASTPADAAAIPDDAATVPPDAATIPDDAATVPDDAATPLDAGIPDDAGFVCTTDAGCGPLAYCERVDDCRPGLECWYIVGIGPACTQRCTSTAECAADYGPNACCTPPGPQSLDRTCVPVGGWQCFAPDAGP